MCSGGGHDGVLRHGVWLFHSAAAGGAAAVGGSGLPFQHHGELAAGIIVPSGPSGIVKQPATDRNCINTLSDFTISFYVVFCCDLFIQDGPRYSSTRFKKSHHCYHSSVCLMACLPHVLVKISGTFLAE